MIYAIEMLNDTFSDYANLYEKIKVEEKNNRLMKIKRGLYTDDINENRFFIANILYSPSYVSFETALSFYNLIPERVNVIKSATYKKNKNKKYDTKFGNFSYQDINPKAYPYGINTMDIDGKRILIASKEKALLDLISVLSPRNSIKEIKQLLFDDLRINEYEFDQLNKNVIMDLCDLYPSKSVKLLKNYIRRFLWLIDI